jgi:hypothetical protein
LPFTVTAQDFLTLFDIYKKCSLNTKKLSYLIILMMVVVVVGAAAVADGRIEE